MNWLRKNNPFESGSDDHYHQQQQQQTSQFYPSQYEYQPPQYAPSRSTSMAPPARSTSSSAFEAPQIFRTYSQNSRRMEAAPPAYEGAYSYRSPSSSPEDYRQQQQHRDHMFRTTSNSYDFNQVTSTHFVEPSAGANQEVEASEEVLVRIPEAMVHLINDQESPLLAKGEFSVVRVDQQGNGILMFVRVGEQLRWPLTKDEPAVKLDRTHYFFTIRVPRPVDEMDSETARQPGGETLSYGVTFQVYGHERELQELDRTLDMYGNFSTPTVVHGDRQKDQQYNGMGGGRSGKMGGMIVPQDVLSSDGKQVTEGNQSEFWMTMAPNVEDYNSAIAKSMAKGTGHIIRGIFWVRDSTVSRLENGSIYMKGRLKSNSKPSQISPRTLRNLKRVRNMSVATESVAKSVLEGVVKTAGFFSGAMLRSKPGKKFFKLLPGEVALVSLDAFAKIFDAVEKAGTDIMQSTSMYTQDVVTHRYGQGAGQVTEETMSTAGHVFATAWTVSKVRRALNPSKFRPSKTGMLKAAAKAAVGGRTK